MHVSITDFSALISAAWEVRNRAYAPYSTFHVGAALLGDDGVIYSGCNVENLSFGLTICAERSAVCAAIAAGCRRFHALVVVADTREPISPCGACRQVMAEFGDFPVLMATKETSEETSIGVLLPRARTGILDSAWCPPSFTIVAIQKKSRFRA
jgi:cytidine deaminase